MAARWVTTVAVLSLVLSYVGPALEERLPKRHAAQREQGAGSRVYSADFERIFQTHALSLPKGPGEKRLVYVGNSALARPSFADTLQTAFARREQEYQVYGLAWPGLRVSGQLLFVRRALKEQPDVLVWAISPVDCLRAPPVLGGPESPLAVSYGTGLRDAIANARQISRDNGFLIGYNLLGQIFPHIRYGNTLAESLPSIPPFAWSRSAHAGSDRVKARIPATPFATPATHPPEVALATLDSARSLMPRSVQWVLLVMPHHAPGASFGSGQLRLFTQRLREWADLNGATVLDLSSMLPDDAFWDGFHFQVEYDPVVAARIADTVLEGLNR